MIKENPDGLNRVFFSVILGCLSLGIFFSCSQDTNTPTKPNETPVFGEFSTGLIKDPKRAYGVMHFSPRSYHAPLQAEYDVEADGGKTPIRDQGACGSCWAFGGTQTFEIGMQKFGGKTIDFAEQDLVGKLFYGCGGGFFTGEFQTKTGQAEEKDCPYQANNTKCSASVKPVAKAENWGLVGQPNRQPTDEELQQSILSYGSVAVTVGANTAFANLKGDVATACPSSGTNHIVALVGWKTHTDGKIYFKVKNSWSTKWGNGGYMYIRRGCWNLAEEASWLAVASVPCQPPKVRLAKEMTLNYGDEVRFAVKPELGVSYSWYRGPAKLSEGPNYDLIARESFVLTLKAQNTCGAGEVISMVTVPQN